MSEMPVPSADRFGAWCGLWLTLAFALTPLVAWAGPLAFAPLVGVAGAFCLPALNVPEDDRPAYIALVVALIWAAGSTVWTPYDHGFFGSPAVKLVAEAGFYFALVCAARRASALWRTRALRVFAWGMAILGVALLVEAATGAQIYRALRAGIGDPVRPDLGVKNVAQGLFVLALLWPAATVAAMRVGAGVWLAIPMLAGLIAGGMLFGYDAPILALAVAGLAGGAVYAWPRMAPRVMGGLIAAYFMAAPWAVLGAKSLGLLGSADRALPPSWAQRVGYWRHAADWITDHPLRGWGLEASRMFSPGIQLHPHDAALQIWLELGLIGAVAAAVFWAALFAGLSRRERDPAHAAAAAGAMAYVAFGAVSFGAWQEWWLALGALTAASAVAVIRQPAPEPRAQRAGAAQKSSTFPLFSE